MSEDKNINFEGKKSNAIKLFFNKIKRIKHLDIILTVLFIAIILLIYFSTFSTSNNLDKNSITENNDVVEYSDETDKNFLSSYSDEIEKKLCEILSELKDVGKVSVAVKMQGNVEYVYAYSTKTETLQDGTIVETKTPILSSEDGKPIILQTIIPSVESVIVIATGAKNTNVKLDILRIIEKLYNLPSSKIEIFVGN